MGCFGHHREAAQEGRKALYFAASACQTQVAGMLLDRGSDVEARDLVSVVASTIAIPKPQFRRLALPMELCWGVPPRQTCVLVASTSVIAICLDLVLASVP